MRRVLIVEDDQSLAWLLEQILSKKYRVASVRNGMEACAWLSEHHHFDLVISDIKMPLMNGIELLENFKVSGLYRDIPVIILSGENDSATKRNCESLGAIAYLVKPFDPETLLKEIDCQFEAKMFA